MNPAYPPPHPTTEREPFPPLGLVPLAPAFRTGVQPVTLTPAPIVSDELLAEAAKHLRTLGTVNILVAGQTGVGKSTLVNGVFGSPFAVTAAGEPVTQHAEWHTSDKVPLRILDTRGLEAKDYLATLTAMRAAIESSRAQDDERNQLHIGWVCIAAPSSRVQECEVDIVRLLNRYDIPAIVVLTKDDDDDEFAALVTQIMGKRNANVFGVVQVRALAKGRRPAVGLHELVAATFTALPDAHRAAFAAAQKVNRELNKALAEDYVTAAAGAAAAASAIPIPFADVATLAPIQAGMLIGISKAFGLTLERRQVTQLVTTLLGCLAITLAGGWALGSVLKFIPGPGSLIGAVVNATVAGAVTRTLGKTYIRFLCSFLDARGRLPSADEIANTLPGFYKNGQVA